MLTNPRTLARLLAALLLVVALVMAVVVQQSPLKPDDWEINVTIGPLNAALLCAAVLLFWLSGRLSKERRSASTKGR